MKIFAIGRNYVDHAKELNNPVPKSPIIFIKPQTALLRNDLPFDLPPFSNQVEYEVEIVLQICRNGKNIHPDNASKYFDKMGIGIDFTARDLQKQCKENGLPWEIAKAFDHSAPVSGFLPIEGFKDINQLKFSLYKNKELVQSGNTKDMIFSFAELIAHISTYFLLNIGDLIFTGTPSGVGKVESSDLLEAYIQKDRLLSCEIK
jgi:2-keto-4-pentenoate hydratase/2-oxohepta-3-ene-1,7-dioic acid hydratase in catechol pathway